MACASCRATAVIAICSFSKSRLEDAMGPWPVAATTKESFVDGDTSTNDSFVVAATGQGPMASSSRDVRKLRIATTALARQLARALVRAAEDASTLIADERGSP